MLTADIIHDESYIKKLFELLINEDIGYPGIPLKYGITDKLDPGESYDAASYKTIENICTDFFKLVANINEEDFEDFISAACGGWEDNEKLVMPSVIDLGGMTIYGCFDYILFSVLYNDKNFFENVIDEFNQDIFYQWSKDELDFEKLTYEEAKSIIRETFQYLPANTEELMNKYVKPYKVI